MATSGVANFNLDLSEIVEEAFERNGSELRTGYDLKTARRSLNLLFADWANRGVNMWTFEQGQQVLTPGTATYALPADTVDLIEHVIRTGAGNVSTQADLTITRISVSTYATIPNKLQQARPIQIWIERLNTPQFTVWPVPDDSQTYTLVYWRLRCQHHGHAFPLHPVHDCRAGVLLGYETSRRDGSHSGAQGAVRRGVATGF